MTSFNGKNKTRALKLDYPSKILAIQKTLSLGDNCLDKVFLIFKL